MYRCTIRNKSKTFRSKFDAKTFNFNLLIKIPKTIELDKSSKTASPSKMLGLM